MFIIIFDHKFVIDFSVINHKNKENITTPLIYPSPGLAKCCTMDTWYLSTTDYFLPIEQLASRFAGRVRHQFLPSQLVHNTCDLNHNQNNHNTNLMNELLCMETKHEPVMRMRDIHSATK